MRYLIKSTILASIVILFSACTPKVLVKKAYAPQILNQNTKNIAIQHISNDSVNLKEKLSRKLDSIYIDGVKYYNIYDNENKATSILSGSVDYNKVKEQRYTKEITNRDYCFLFKGERYERRYAVSINHRVKHPICLKYAKDIIPCIKKEHELQTTLKLTNSIDSSIILLKTYNSSTTTSHCINDNRNIYTQKIQNDKMANDIIDQFISDITPRYRYFKIDIIDKVDISLTKNQKSIFTKAIDAIKNSDIRYAKVLLTDLNQQINQQSSTILYDLGLVEESLGNIYSANSLYSKAVKTSNNQTHIDLIYSGLNRTNEQISTTKAIEPLID
jgi:hypothetical protein